jgi:hypothetical protein
MSEDKSKVQITVSGGNASDHDTVMKALNILRDTLKDKAGIDFQISEIDAEQNESKANTPRRKYIEE